MKTRDIAIAIAVTLASYADVHALTGPSDSDGPVKLLTCTVTPTGVLQASVESISDDAMSCNIRCNYELGDRTFSQSFSELIPARFHGNVGRFDTNGGKAGNYSGEIGTCTKTSAHG